MYMIEENSLNDDLSSVISEDEGTSCGSMTYATLTTIPPLSSERLGSQALTLCGYNPETPHSELIRTDSAYSSDYDSLASCYEGLEPLPPSVYIDDEGNMIECDTSSSLSSSCSYFIRSTYLLPEFSHYDWTGPSESSRTNTSTDLIGYRNFRSSLDSAVSSRGSSPEPAPWLPTPTGTNPHCAGSTQNPYLASALSTVLNLDDFEIFMGSEVIETRELSELISTELRRCNIPQALFAAKVLGRSQGTLSDLLRNPKPWSKLKTGRETYGKMWMWLLEPDAQRMIPFKNCGYKFDFKSPTEEVYQVESCSTNGGEQSGMKVTKTKASAPPSGCFEKKPRILFTEAQRFTLRAVFDQDERPSKEVITTLSDQLELPFTTVANFFMNARRRSRNRPSDEPGVSSESLLLDLKEMGGNFHFESQKDAV